MPRNGEILVNQTCVSSQGSTEDEESAAWRRNFGPIAGFEPCIYTVLENNLEKVGKMS